jgi:hypothetical protein
MPVLQSLELLDFPFLLILRQIVPRQRRLGGAARIC